MVPPPSSATAPAGAPVRDAAAERARQLFEDHHREVLRFLRRRDPDLAEDALSETFAVAVRRAADIPDGRELPWLYVVAEHVLRNLQRSRRRAARIPEALHPFTRHTTEAPTVPFVGEALDGLPDRERILLTMTAFEGLSATEAASRMGISYGSARNALSSGRKRLAVVLASAAAVVLVVGLVAAAVGSLRGQRAELLATLASRIDEARVVHDVAVVRHDPQRANAPADQATASSPAARYERWSDRSGDRTRVRLPGGAEVVAGRGETLRSASRSVTASKPAARRRAVREDLSVLDAASPTVIAGLLADPAAKRTATDGPTIAGHDTTTVRGRITDAAGAEHAVRVFIADDEPTVLRVRVRGVADASEPAIRADDVSTVDFVAWTAVPRERPTPTASATATTPAIASAGGLAVTPAAATGAVVGASVASTDGGRPAAGSRAASTDGGRTDPADVERAPRPDRSTGTSGKRDPAPRSPIAPGTPVTNAPVIHVRQTVQSCVTSSPPAAGGCTDYGDREIWLELAGERRSRARAWHATGRLRNEEWSSATERRYFAVSPDGLRTLGRIERFRSTPASRRGLAPTPPQWRGEWLARLAPTIAALRRSTPARFDELAAGPDVDGAPTRLLVTNQPDGPRIPYTVDVAADAVTREPRLIRVHRTRPAGGGETVTMKIAQWEQLPAAAGSQAVTRSFPRGTRITRR